MWLYKKWKKFWFLTFDGKKKNGPRKLFGPQGENMFQCLFQIQPRRIMKKEELLIVRSEIMEVKALQEEKLKSRQETTLPAAWRQFSKCLSHEHLELHLTNDNSVFFIFPFFKWDECLFLFLSAPFYPYIQIFKGAINWSSDQEKGHVPTWT